MITYNEFRFDKDNDTLYYFDFPITNTLYNEIIGLYNLYSTDIKSKYPTELIVDEIHMDISNSIVLRSTDNILRLSIPNDIDSIQTYLKSLDDIGEVWGIEK